MLIIDLLILILMSEYNTENKISREYGYNGRVERVILPRGIIQIFEGKHTK
jgi:hypothetical protein